MIWIGISTVGQVEFRHWRILGLMGMGASRAAELGLDCLRRLLLTLLTVERIEFERS